jgi:hypothetical protein
MADIKVPKPPKSAFNPNRPASDLLKNQVAHLEWAIRNAGERVIIDGAVKASAGAKIKPVKTEADASARMTALLPRLESAANLPFGAMPIPESVAPAQSKPARRRTARRAVKRTPQRNAKRKVAKRKAPKRKAKRAKR